ncbi:glutamate receptor ionotropic, kainate 2-like isoform X1 [Bacillus rossius redtenbacheri]|uniref:glutamate receptor ionotropic, kainate 2-like isoform X1 n=1 Tax=Bacillus rossius redtenbacheri TaxID=93214 RepID=UPI002FDECD69
MLVLVAIILSCLSCAAVREQKEPVRIGGLFDAGSVQEEQAFRLAADMVNSAAPIRRYRLVPHVAAVGVHGSFEASQKVCGMLLSGVVAMFGPTTGEASHVVQSICDSKDIPHIEARWDVNQHREAFLVNLYPYKGVFGKVFLDLIKFFEWKRFTIIYESSSSLVRLNDLLKMYEPKKGTVTIRQLDAETKNYRDMFYNIKKSGDLNYVVDCSPEILYDVLIQAQQIGIMSDQHNYIITTLDLHTVNLEPFQYGGAKITGVNIIDLQELTAKLASWSNWFARNGQAMPDFTLENFKASSALMYDAVHLFAGALRRMQGLEVNAGRVDCNSYSSWMHGASLINIMKDSDSSFKGLSGLVQFDNEGFRSNFKLDVLKLTSAGLKQVGNWHSAEGLNVSNVIEDEPLSTDENTLRNKTLIVLISLTKPYIMTKISKEALFGNDRYEGFGIDLIKEMGSMLQFNYTFVLHNDSSYGNIKNGEWTGMIRKIRDGVVDLAITDLTITAERESGADFTMPFMNLGISILYKKPKKAPPELFSFMAPFSLGVWGCMLSVYVGTSVLLYLMGRICPYEWVSPFPCMEEPDELENQFSLGNCMWFTIGSLLQQGSEIAPIASSTRMAALALAFFKLILVSSYTANLAAFLTIETTTSPFTDVKSLAQQKTVKYGAKMNGATYLFFKESTDPVYQKMYKYMLENKDEVMSETNEIGEERVKSSDEDYAFLMESSSIDYIVERNCDLARVGGLLDNKGYGIAMKKGAPYRNLLTTAVLKLQESGKLTSLVDKWWKQERGGGACKDKAASNSPEALGLQNVGGVFLVLVTGTILAAILTIMELLVHVYQTCKKENLSFREELKAELQFVARCHGSTKPVRRLRKEEDDRKEEETDDVDFIAMNTFQNGFQFKEPLA